MLFFNVLLLPDFRLLQNSSCGSDSFAELEKKHSFTLSRCKNCPYQQHEKHDRSPNKGVYKEQKIASARSLYAKHQFSKSRLLHFLFYKRPYSPCNYSSQNKTDNKNRQHHYLFFIQNYPVLILPSVYLNILKPST